jgi:hypothetical protein
VCFRRYFWVSWLGCKFSAFYFCCCNPRNNSVLKRLPTLVSASVVPSDWEQLDPRVQCLFPEDGNTAGYRNIPF